MSRKTRTVMTEPRPAVTEPVAETSLIGLLLKIWWMAFGNLPILFIPLLIVKNRVAGFSRYDVMFIVAWLLLGITRIASARFFEPAEPGEIKKYLLILTAVSAGMIGAAHLYLGLAG